MKFMYSLCGSLLSFPVKAMFLPAQTIYCRVMTVTNKTSHIKFALMALVVQSLKILDKITLA